MKAVIYEAFGAPPQLKNVPDPTPEAHGVVVKTMATGVCLSDWHGDGSDTTQDVQNFRSFFIVNANKQAFTSPTSITAQAVPSRAGIPPAPPSTNKAMSWKLYYFGVSHLA